MDTGVWMAISGALGVVGKWVYDIVRARGDIARVQRKDAIDEWRAHVERQDAAIAQLRAGLQASDKAHVTCRVQLAQLRTCLHYQVEYMDTCRQKLIELGHDPGKPPTVPQPDPEEAEEHPGTFQTRQALHSAALVQEASRVIQSPPESPPEPPQ